MASRADLAAAAPPTAPAERSPGLDLARGGMLLLIALANVHTYLFAHPVGVRGYPAPDELGLADRVVTFLQLMLVDGRAYPMFALLYGYGLAQIVRRQSAAGAGAPVLRRLLRRRSGWLLLLGLGHAGLLYSGDILGTYGLVGLAVAGLVVAGGDRRLLVVAGLFLVPLLLGGAVQALPLPDGTTAMLFSVGADDPAAAAMARLAEWVFLTTFMVLAVLSAVLLGVWAARGRLLEDGGRGTRLAGRTAVAGLATAALGGLPLAVLAVGGWPGIPLGVRLGAGALHAVSGYAGGVGYVCLAVWLARRLHGRAGAARSAGGRLGAALVATGQRSLSCYLAQSVVFVALLPAYGGGLGADIGVATASALAVLTWAATVLGAAALARAGRRGPFEVLLRRLTYGSAAGRPTAAAGRR
jgi:uncharacterized protein